MKEKASCVSFVEDEVKVAQALRAGLERAKYGMNSLDAESYLHLNPRLASAETPCYGGMRAAVT